VDCWDISLEIFRDMYDIYFSAVLIVVDATVDTGVSIFQTILSKQLDMVTIVLHNKIDKVNDAYKSAITCIPEKDQYQISCTLNKGIQTVLNETMVKILLATIDPLRDCCFGAALKKKLKFVLLGDSGVGKTALSIRSKNEKKKSSKEASFCL